MSSAKTYSNEKKIPNSKRKIEKDVPYHKLEMLVLTRIFRIESVGQILFCLFFPFKKKHLTYYPTKRTGRPNRP